MLKQLINFNRNTKFLLACSGGVDSMAIADFYKKGNKNFELAYFNHGTKQSMVMQDFIIEYGKQNNVNVRIGSIKAERQKTESLEEYWRNERYNWLKSYNLPIVTCHHLNDAMETWVFGMCNGDEKYIAIANNNVYRPFLTNTKQQLIDWCIKHDVKWIEDLSNQDVNFPRNRIRHVILPEMLKVNPGLEKVIRKKVLDKFKLLKETEMIEI